MRIYGLYIKFDKKFIVRANKIIVKKSERSKDAKSEISEIIEKIKYFKYLFKEFSVESLRFEDNLIRFYYLNDVFHFDSKYLSLESSIDGGKDVLRMGVKRLFLKDFNLSVKGALKANFVNDSGYFDGDFSLFNINGKAKLVLRDGILDYYLSTKEFDSLEPFMKFLEGKVKIHPKISAWIYKKVVAKRYKIDYLEGRYDLKKGDFFLDEVKALAEAKEAKIFFHPKLKEIDCENISIFFEKGNLKFKLKNPFYADKNLTGSLVKISSLTKPENSSVEIVIKTLSPFDKEIEKILKAYGIEVPLLQTRGEIRGFLSIKIPRFKKKNLDLKGEFFTKESDFVIASVPLSVKRADLFLDNESLVFKDAEIFRGDLFDLKTKGILDLKSGVFNGDLLIGKFNVERGGEKILDLRNVKSGVRFSFDENSFSVSLPDLFSKAYFSGAKNVIEIKYLFKLYPYSPLLKRYSLKNGTVKIETKDFKRYEIEAYLKDLKLPLSYKNGKKVESLRVSLLAENDALTLRDEKGFVTVDVSKDKAVLKIKDLDLDLKRENGKKSLLKAEKKFSKKRKIALLAENSDVLTDSFRLRCSSYNALISGDKVDFECSFGNNKIFFIKEGDSFKLSTKGLTAEFINLSAKKTVFIGGKFGLNANGNEKSFKGKFSFSDTTLKNFEVFNNLMAFINTIPSLLFLQNPNFSSNGYKIKNGEIEFVKIENILTFTKIAIKGYSADINGLGYVNLSSGYLDLNLEISTFQNIDKIIKHIPIVGYIILGKDGRNSVGVKVRGDFRDPKVETYLVKDIFKMPFNILKRTLDFPFMLFSPSRNR